MTAAELKECFDGRELPKGPVSPHKSVVVDNPEYFVQSQFYALDHVNDKAKEPFILRLIQFKEWMEANGK